MIIASFFCCIVFFCFIQFLQQFLMFNLRCQQSIFLHQNSMLRHGSKIFIPIRLWWIFQCLQLKNRSFLHFVVLETFQFVCLVAWPPSPTELPADQKELVVLLWASSFPSFYFFCFITSNAGPLVIVIEDPVVTVKPECAPITTNQNIIWNRFTPL